MADKLPVDLPATTVGRKVTHAVNTDNTTDGPEGTSEQSTVNTPLSILRYVDNSTSSTARDGSLENPYISSTEASLAITDNAISKQYTLIIIKDDGTSNDAKPYIYQRGTNGQDFTGGARIPNVAGRYEYSNMVCGNINSDNLLNTAEVVITDVEFLAGSSIFTIGITSSSFTFVRCKFGGKMDFRQIEANFIDCDVSAIEFIDNTLVPKNWSFDRCRFGGAFTTSGSSIGCNFEFIGCHWLPSSSFAPTWPMSVTCDSTFPFFNHAQVTITTKTAEYELLNNPFNPTTDINVELILSGQSVALNQDPAGLGTANAIQIEFGPAIVTSAVSLDVDGRVTFHEAGTYHVKTALQFGRNGSSGESEMLFRVTDGLGSQIGRTIAYLVDNNRVTKYLEHDQWVSVGAGARLTYELMRDSGGDDSGGLESFDPTPDGLTWSIAPSAFISIKRWAL